MTWEEKFQACHAIGSIELKMRKPGDWYINHSVERVEGDLLSGGCVTNAGTPEHAVNQHWAWLTDKRFAVRIRSNGVNRNVRWNGFMWADVEL